MTPEFVLPIPQLDPQAWFPRPLWEELGLTAGGVVSPRAVDAAHRGLAERTPMTRLAWKVLRDADYQEVYRRFGTARALLEAGFFDDQLSVPVEYTHAWRPGLVTPFHKLLARAAALPPGQPAVVLVATGAFAPVHLGHLAMMDSAREAVEASGATVLAGYLSPSHDDYVAHKRDGQARPVFASRLAHCQEAVADSDWLMVDPWEGRYAPTALNFTDVVRRLQEYLEGILQANPLQVVYVFGSDNCGFLAAQACAEDRATSLPSRLCVAREGMDVQLRERLAGLAGAGVATWLVEGSSQHRSASSTRIRGGELSAQVPRQRHGDAIEGPRRYLVRNDLRWALKDWPQEARSEAPAFLAGLCDALENAFLGAAVAGMQVLRLSHESQQRHVQRLVAVHGPRAVSLDACSCTPSQLRMSRCFGLADGQVFSRDVVARPGAPALDRQVLAIPLGPIVLIEDDVASGTTVNRVRELLAGRCEIAGIELLTAHSLRELGAEHAFFDIVDARDFLLGAQEGGLVVQTPAGELARAPYLLPWVSNVFRAKLPCEQEVAFSRALWRLNANWLKAHAPERCLKDAPAALQTLLVAEGFLPDSSLWGVAAHYLQLLQDAG